MEVTTVDQAVQLFIQYIDVAQKHGSFSLEEASTLKRVIDFYDKSQEKDPKLNERLCMQLLCNAMVKGNKAGSFSIGDAALLDKTIRFVVESFNKESEPSGAVGSDSSA